MQKIEKCNGKDCPIKNNCYRYTTREKSEHRVNFVYDKKEGCQEFIPTKFVTGL